MDKIVVLPCRIIPCDFGHQIDDKIFYNIINYVNQCRNFKVIYKTDDLNENEILSVEIKIDNNEYTLNLHIFSDGIGIFVLIDKKEEYNLKNFNHKKILETRAEVHREILTHCHHISNIFNEHTSKIRSYFDNNQIRFTASPEWEKKGISYVMSFYFIICDINLLKNKEMEQKICSLLFPLYEYDKEDKIFNSDHTNLDIKNFEKQEYQFCIDDIRKDYDPLPYLHVCASWANVLIIGKINDDIISEYIKLEKDLQHIWFYAYITDKIIDQSLKNISIKTPEEKLDEIDDILTDMTCKIDQYEGIIRSTIHERYFHIYNLLKTTSKLDLLTASIDKKIILLKDRYSRILSTNRNRIERRIQYILIIIAILSLFPILEKFTNLTWYYYLLLVFLIVIIFFIVKPR